MGLFATAVISRAQTWSVTGAPTNSWECIASSADGSRLIAGVWPGLVYLSTNSGTTWTPAATPNDNWASVASSADGTKLLAVSDTGGWVLTSPDAGTTWVTNNLPTFYWGSAASSADGNTLVVASPISGYPEGAVFISTNAGLAWTSNYLGDATSVAMSADGTKIVVVASPNVWRSTNSGTTWAQLTNAPALWSWVSPSQYIASSADGKKLFYAVTSDINHNPGPIYISTNSGDSWNPTSSGSNFWGYVACSADGNTLLAVPYTFPSPNSIYLSTNCGATWTTNNSPQMAWGMVAASSDGGKLFAAAEGNADFAINSGSIYTLQSVQPPLMGITLNHGDVLISWLAPSTNFVLQESPDLSGWSAVTNTPVLNLNNLQNEVTLSSTNIARFYRLKTP